MSELALHLREEDTRDGTLRAIVHATLELIPATRWAGISLLQRDRLTVEAANHDLVFELGQLQSDYRESPRLSAIRHRHTVRVADLASPDQPWPRFAAHARKRGIRSVMSLPLSLHLETLGALTLYAPHPHAFTPDAQYLAELLARHAAVALTGATREHHLNAALVNRDLLGQAKGILMQRDQLTATQAFHKLVHTSQHTNTKIADVARQLITEPRTTPGSVLPRRPTPSTS